MEIKYTLDNITELQPNEIFVFGSNLDGRHGKGAALTAKTKFGAKEGVAEGLTGQCYAFPTVYNLNPYIPIRLHRLEWEYITNLEICIGNNPNLTFLITAGGCGLAGYKVEQIAPLFKHLNTYPNVTFPRSFWDVWDLKQN